jgi:hypothetical protein
MNSLPMFPYFHNAKMYYIDNVWLGGKIGYLEWLRNEYDAEPDQHYCYLVFNSDKKMNWFVLRFGEECATF